MQAPSPESVAWFLGAIQVLGLASAWLARVGERSACRRWYQGLFCGFLVLVSIGAFFAMQVGPGASITSGATLAIMVLAATCDFSSRGEAAI
jgi:hypothetical protein